MVQHFFDAGDPRAEKLDEEEVEEAEEVEIEAEVEAGNAHL